MKKVSVNVIIVMLFCFCASHSAQKDTLDKFSYYKQRYKVECAGEKITDNFGNGFENLYGTRNMRTILYGTAYRGGANNYYHKHNKRKNHNPLPEDGLENLLDEGFSCAVYLYSKNYSGAKKLFVNDKHDTLRYYQNSGMSRKSLKEILLMVKDVIENEDKGPVYLHCWNGWHQSGWVSSAVLMQFCGVSNKQAYEYWLENTDGVSKGYENVKNMVKTFVPFEDIEINDAVKQKICPCLKK